MQCCDPYLVTYISAIITMVEAAIFACLNLVIILINTCAIPPPDSDKGIITTFLKPIWTQYLLENGTCNEDKIPPGWVFPALNATDSGLTPQKNYEYQIAYIVLHFSWIIISIVLIFGNARKLWGYYIPWMLMTTTIIIMDTVIGAMYLDNLKGIPAADIFNADFWMGMFYMRFEAIWFMNIIQLFNVLHAFCLCYRKRAKQARRDKKIEEKVRAEVALEQISSQQQQQPDLQQQQQQQQQQMMKQPDAADLGRAVSRAPAPRSLKDERNQQAMEMVTRSPPRYTQPPQPDVMYRNPSNAPKESRPYSYLNPGFRPSDSHDVDGMKRHGVPSHPGVTNKAYVRDEDRMPRPQSRRRSLDDFPDENGYVSDSPLNRGNRQFRPPQGGGAAAGPGVRRNQSFRPAPGGYNSDHDNQRQARYSQRPPALPRVATSGPPPSRGPDPYYRDPINRRNNRQPYEY